VTEIAVTTRLASAINLFPRKPSDSTVVGSSCALRVQDATERWASWLSNQEALEALNIQARHATREQIAAYVARFDCRSHSLLGIFDRSNHLLVGILRIDRDHRSNRALINLMIGEASYRNMGVTSEIFIPALNYGFNDGINPMMASVLRKNVLLRKFLIKTGWKQSPGIRTVRSNIDGSSLEVLIFLLSRKDWEAWKQTDRAKRVVEILKNRRTNRLGYEL
jgi:RimJ/RimL family protein N-acetyltransferase